MKLDYYSIMNKYSSLKDGAPQMAAIQKAIELADSEKDYECALRFRYDYIKQSVFDDDSFKAIIMFPQYLSIYDGHEELHKSNFKDVMWAYKWILNSVTDFYQVSHDDIMNYFEDFKKRIIENGRSLRIYYYLFSEYIEDIDINEYKKIAHKYLNYKRDSLSDCKACELNSEVYYEVYYGSFKKALKKAIPILNGTEECGYVPASTYNSFLDYYNKHNDIESGKKYEQLLAKEIKTDISFLTEMSSILEYWAIADCNKGIKKFEKYVKLDLKSKNVRDKFNFELGAYKLFKNLKEHTDKDEIKLLLDERFPIYKEDGIYKLDEVISYYKSNILYIADRFDKRNGNNYFKDKVR